MAQETINIILALLAFGVLHSLTAAIGVKAVFVAMMGERAYLGLYRLFYNTVSAITLLPILLLMVAQPGAAVWALDGAAALGFYALQGLGLLGLAVSLLQIDGMAFLGVKQVAAYFAGEKLPLPPEPLAVGGVYALVRHPLYFFSLLFLWFSPQMSAAGLGLALGASVYFVVGSWLEERKLVRYFGQPYIEYQRRVAWMIPFVRWG